MLPGRAGNPWHVSSASDVDVSTILTPQALKRLLTGIRLAEPFCIVNTGHPAPISIQWWVLCPSTQVLFTQPAKYL